MRGPSSADGGERGGDLGSGVTCFLPALPTLERKRERESNHLPALWPGELDSVRDNGGAVSRWEVKEGARAGWPLVLQGMLTVCLENATKERMGHRAGRINRGSGCTACGRRAEYSGAAFPRPGFSKMGCCSLYALVPVLVVQVAGGVGVLPAPAEIPEPIRRVAWTPAVPSSW